ncbi:MAG: GNAT family N-acetyltransferase, partial [Propionibacteriaceae bacterium]|nr:GNAT family N-acetyltransferase [Propionibacteriaceae bacterium]
MITRAPGWPAEGLRWPDSVPTLIDPERRVVLRAHRGDDLERLVEMCADPEFARWTTVPSPYGLTEGQAFLSSALPGQVDGGQAMVWAIEAIDAERRAQGGPAQF